MATGSLAILLLPSGGVLAQGPAQGASPEVLDISVASAAVNPGEPVLVRTTILNPFPQEMEFPITLLVDEVPEEERVTLLPGEATRIVNFIVVRSEPGVHIARLGDQAISFLVLSPQLTMRDLQVAPPVVAAGEPVTILVTVRNVGPTPSSFQVPLVINGQVREVRSKLLPTGERVTAAFQIREFVPGSYTVLVGDLPGSFTVIGPTVDFTVPVSVPISELATIALAEGGQRLSVTGGLVSLRTISGGAMELLLPIALKPGEVLASFRDPVSQIVYDGESLVVPLRNALFQEVVRLIVEPADIIGLGSGAQVTARSLRLVVPSTPLLLPGVSSPAGPLFFSADLPVRRLTLDAPLRLTPGLRPTPEALAKLEVMARSQERSIGEVVAMATSEISATFATEGSAAARVTFGVSRGWVESLESGKSVAIVQLHGDDQVEIFDVEKVVTSGEEMSLSASVMDGQGTFLLVVLTPWNPSKVAEITLSHSVAIVGEPVEVRAIVDRSSGEGASSSLVLRVNGEPVGLEPVQELDRDSRQAAFYITLDQPGRYIVEVEGQAINLPASLPDILGYIQVVQLTISPERTAPGQLVTMSTIVLNAGPSEVVSDAVLFINGAPEESLLLRLPSGTATNLQFQVVRDRPGAYSVLFMNARGDFTVVAEPTPPSFEVLDLNVEPQSVGLGQTVTVSLSVINKGEEEGLYTALLMINQREFQRKELSVEGLTTVPVAFSVESERAGLYSVEIGTLKRDYVVLPPKELAIVLVELDVRPQAVPGGDLVVVTVDLFNRRRTPQATELVVSINDAVIEEREVTLGGDETKREIFSLSRDEPGRYQVKVQRRLTSGLLVGQLSQEFLVTRALTPASFEILRIELSPIPAVPLEPLSLRFQLSNLGEKEGTFDIRVMVDGVLEVREEVRLAGQTSRQLTIPLKGLPAGTYIVEVNGAKIQLPVGGEETPTQVPEEPSQEKVYILEVTPERQDRPWILFAALGGALLLVAATLFGLLRWERATRPGA